MSDPTPVPIHVSGEQIVAMLPTQHLETIETIEGLKGVDVIDLTALNNLLGLILTAIDNLNGTVEGLAVTVELLNNNASQNAQQQQAIQLGAIGACCEDPAFGTGEVDQLCELSQDAIAYVVSRLLVVGAEYAGVRLPTVAELQSLFTFVGVDGRSYLLLSVTEANKLLAALASLSVGGLSGLGCLLTDEPIKAAVLNLLGTSNSAEQSYIRIQALPTSGYDCSTGAVRAFFAAFSPTLINTLWKDPPIWDASGYDDICGEEPPFEGTGYAAASTITGELGHSEWSATRNVWDLNAATIGNITPRPFLAVGETLYIYNCGNPLSYGGRDQSIYLATSNTDEADIFLEVPLETEVEWITDGTRFLYLWCRDQNERDGSQVATLRAAWVAGEAITHCPS